MHEEVIRQRDIELEGKDQRIRTMLLEADILRCRLATALTTVADLEDQLRRAAVKGGRPSASPNWAGYGLDTAAVTISKAIGVGALLWIFMMLVWFLRQFPSGFWSLVT
jgi:hypothetical protein